MVHPVTAQAYDRAVLRMKGADAATNFPAGSYGELDSAEPSAPLQTADASCTITLPGAAATPPAYYSEAQQHCRSGCWVLEGAGRLSLTRDAGSSPAVCAHCAPAAQGGSLGLSGHVAVCAADTGASGESEHPSPSRPCNAPLPLFKGRPGAQLSPLGANPPAGSDGYVHSSLPCFRHQESPAAMLCRAL